MTSPDPSRFAIHIRVCIPIRGFERCVALAVLAKSIHRLGTALREQQKERLRRKRGPCKKAA